MSKVTLQNCLNRLRELGHAPTGSSSRKGASYRSSFQRSIGAIVFLFGYFVLASQMLGGGDGSADNGGIFALLFFAAVFGGLGAFFAPRIAAFLHSQSLSGRRQQVGKSRHSSSSSSRSSSREGSSSSRNKSKSDHDRARSSRSSSGRSD